MGIGHRDQVTVLRGSEGLHVPRLDDLISNSDLQGVSYGRFRSSCITESRALPKRSILIISAATPPPGSRLNPGKSRETIEAGVTPSPRSSRFAPAAR